MASRPLRVALVGTGMMAERFHAPALRELSSGGRRLALRAVCDLDAERAERFAARFGFDEVYTSVESLLERAKLDALWVLTPPSATAAVAMRAVRRGLPCFLEKPPAASLAEAKKLLAAIRRRRVPVHVSFNRRFMPLLRQALAWVRAEGPVRAVQCHFYRYRRLGASFVEGTGIHGIDALRAIAGEVTEVTTDKCDVWPKAVPRPRTRTGKGRGATAYFSTLRFRGGAVGQLSVIPAAGCAVERYVIHGEECTAWLEAGQEWVDDYPGTLVFRRGPVETLRAETPSTLSHPVHPMRPAGFLGSSEAFVQALETGTPPASDMAGAVRSMALAEAIGKGGTHRFRG